MPNCLNCNDPWVKGEVYCSNCGQKTKMPNLSLWTLIVDFFQNIFNLEAKIWLTLRDIWVPGKITKAYLHGKRVKYYNPIRIFLITLFALFAFILSLINDKIDQVNTFRDDQKKQINDQLLSTQLDSLLTSYAIDTTIIKNTQKGLFGDILASRIELPDTTIELSTGGVNLSGLDEAMGLSLADIYTLSPKEMEEKLKDKENFQRTMYLQAQKIFKEPGKGIAFILGNGTWAVVLTILFLSLFFKLIYVRRGYLAVEHFLFHLNGHTRLFLIGIILCLLTKLFGYSDWYQLIFHLSGMIYLFLSMKYFYEQSNLKTFFKFFLSLFAFLLLSTLSALCILYVSFLVF